MEIETALNADTLKRRYERLLQLAGFLQEDAFRLFCHLGALSPQPSAPVLEVGIFCGRSLAALALAFPDAEAVGVDPMFDEFDNEYAQEGEGAFLARAANYASPERRLAILVSVLKALEEDGESGLAARVRIERVTQAQFLSSIGSEPKYQLVHLDGEHTYAAVYEAMEHLLRLLIPGGWLVMDDYSNPGFPEIAEAIHRHRSFRKDLMPVMYGFNKGIFLWRADPQRRQAVLDSMERTWHVADFLVRPMADKSVVVDRKARAAPSEEARPSLRQRVAWKLHGLVRLLEK